MIFTTTKKKIERGELFPDEAVLIAHVLPEDKSSKSVFSLNSKAMQLFGFPMNTANVSKLTHGYDENNNLVLATIDADGIYTSNVTAKNTFSNLKFFERLSKQFGIDGFSEEYFRLHLIEEDESGRFVGIERINPVTLPDTVLADSFNQYREAVAEEILTGTPIVSSDSCINSEAISAEFTTEAVAESLGTKVPMWG